MSSKENIMTGRYFSESSFKNSTVKLIFAMLILSYLQHYTCLGPSIEALLSLFKFI